MITVSELTKKFGTVTALDNVTVTIPDGRITALIGPNGSGKTTLLKCLLGLVTPTAGQIVVNGIILDGDAEYRRQIGYMPQIARFPDNLRVAEVLDLVRRIRAHDTSENLDLFHEFGLGKELGKKVSWLSGGTQQKLSAVIATMFQPRIAIFDEPTAGLDPLARKSLKEKIRAIGETGATVIITSHFFSEVESLADDIIYLFEGTVRYAGTMADLLVQTNENRLDDAIAGLMNSDNHISLWHGVLQ